MNKKMLRIATVGAVTSVAVSGMAFAAAAPASAAPVKGKIFIGAPGSVNVGSAFAINCQAKKLLHGQDVWLVEKGAKFNASRVVASNGNCYMQVYTEITGTHQFFIKSKKNGQVYKSNVVTIKVS